MDKKQKIIEAATALIKEQGYDKTSVSQIVKRAGVAQGTYYLYFGAKSDLVTEIASSILLDQLARIQERAEGLNLSETIDVIIDVSFDVTRETSELITFLYSGFAFDDSFEKWDSIYRPYYEWLTGRIDSAGPYSGKEELARLIVGVTEHAAEAYYLSKQRQNDEETARSNVKQLLQRAIGA